MECLLELDSEIVALKPLNGGGGKVVVLLRNKVLLVAGATGHVLWSCALAFAKRASAVDCLYFEDEELLVIACSDSSLQTVFPATGVVVSSVAWPTQPRTLLQQQTQRGPAGSLAFIVCAEGAHVCQVSLQPGHLLPTAPALPSSSVAPSAARKAKSADTSATVQTPNAAEFHAACAVGNQSLSMAASFPGASLAAKSAVSIVTWSLAPAEVGTTKWLLSSDSGCNTVTLDGDSVLSLCAHPADAASLSVVVSFGRARSSSTSSLNGSSSSSSSSNSSSNSSSSSSSGKGGKAKWIKLGLDGRVLFERVMQEAPLFSCMHASGSRALLWTLSSGVGQVSLRAWDACYGVSSFSHTERHNQAVSACFAVLPEGSGEAASNGATFFSSSSLLVTILLVANTPGGGSALLKASLYPPAASLASALGQLAPPPAVKTKSAPESSGSAGKAPKAKNTGPLNSLAPSVKRKLIQAAQRGEALERLEAEDEEKDARRANGPLEQEDKDEADKEGGTKKMARHSSSSRPRRYLDVPMDSSRLFLSQLEETPAAEILTSDWDIAKALIRAGIVSLSSNRSLIAQAVQCQRIDVLSCIARFVTDLSEEQCVRMLKLCVCVPDHALERLSIEDGGALRWGSNSSAAAAAAAAGASEAAAAAAASPEAAAGKGKGKARRKSGGPNSSTKQQSITHLDLVRVVAESLLLRAGAFSSILLGEAIRRHLSPASSLLLLRVFVHMLRGLCAPCTDSSKVHLGQFRDQQVCRATCWAEGLLDAHFAATVLNITTHDAPTLTAVRSALDAVGQAKRASQSVETLLGLWTHIARAISAGKDAAAGPPSSSYQLETLRL